MTALPETLPELKQLNAGLMTKLTSGTHTPDDKRLLMHNGLFAEDAAEAARRVTEEQERLENAAAMVRFGPKKEDEEAPGESESALRTSYASTVP